MAEKGQNTQVAVKKAFTEIQKAFEGEAEKAGLQNEYDVNKLIKEVRSELANERYAGED